MARWTSSAAISRLATSARKSSRPTNQASTLECAITVAEHTPRSMRAISPNISPSENRATMSVPPPGSATRASAAPARIRNAPREASPCRTSTEPFMKDTSRATERSCLNGSCCSAPEDIRVPFARECTLGRLSPEDAVLSEKAELIDPSKLLGVVAEVAREARPHVEAYVALDSSLERDLGLDSLARVELVLRLEREVSASLPEQALASSETPRDLLRFLLASAGQAPHAADRSVASLAQSQGIRPPHPAPTLVEAPQCHVQRQP